ncbi:glycosyltransferase family 2 protein [Chitinispirillales bacterium ANBcel5]|uniref:glycosyltransferase family 2 protein n=1 Tax=Cellulosispirillum alkaliphilum TaxID=3039283 RepID=UPI002A500982|nr:glycosyltransferase family 2 protein [Chitinispirillales bacterium ANBcel5]
MKISLIIPCFNEEENVEPTYKEICRVWESALKNYDLEMIFIDDGSTDSTFFRLQKLLKHDKRVVVLKLSKNFGHQKAIFSGMVHARGDAAVQLDCDLQDPPSLIPKFVKAWEQGYHVVYGIRRKRDESACMQKLRKVGYSVIKFLSESDIPADAGDFRLIDRKIIDALKRMDDDQTYLRGVIASMGFQQIGIGYDRCARHKGKSKYTLAKLFKLGLNGILNHSIVPLRVATWTGLAISAVTVLMFSGYFLLWSLGIGTWPKGFATTTFLLLFSIGLNAIFLGIIGEYLGRIYKVVKKSSLIHVQHHIDRSCHPSLKRKRESLLKEEKIVELW